MKTESRLVDKESVSIWLQRVPFTHRRWIVFSLIIFLFLGVLMPVSPAEKGCPHTMWDFVVFLKGEIAHVGTIGDAVNMLFVSLIGLIIYAGITAIIALILGAVAECGCGICRIIYNRGKINTGEIGKALIIDDPQSKWTPEEKAAVLTWLASVAVCALVILSAGIDGAQYLAVKWMQQMSFHLLTGGWGWSSFNGLFIVAILCIVNVLLVRRLIRFFWNPNQTVRALALVGIGMQLISIVANESIF